MNAAAVLARLRDLGIFAEARGNGLALRPASAIPGALLAAVKAHKAELLALLAANVRDGWGLTAAERAEGLARLNVSGEASTTPAAPLPSPSTASQLLGGPAVTPETVAAWVEHAAAEALDGYEAPQPPPSLPALGTPERARCDNRQTAMVTGLLRVALQRPPSWADVTALPSRGCFCSCCKGQSWWSERQVPRGWRCWACHPPDHLPPEAVRTVQT